MLANWNGVPSQTFRPFQQHFTLCKISLGDAQTCRVVYRLERFQIVSCWSSVSYELGVSFPLQLRIRGPRIDPKVVLFITHRRLVLGQFLIQLSCPAKIFGAIALDIGNSCKPRPVLMRCEQKTYSLSLQMVGTSSTS